MPEKAYKPAVAYTTIAAMLLDRYFLRQPPARGILLEITGSDGVPTQWAFDPGAATIVTERARAKGLIVRPLGTYPSTD